MTTKRTIGLAFLTPTPGDHWVNQLTGYMSKHKKCHIEIFFETINQCFSIMWGETAGLRQKNLSNPNYEIITLAVSQKEYDECLQYCRSVDTQNLIFDDVGMWLSFFTPGCTGGASQDKGKTFCSKIIAEALQFADVGEFDNLSPSGSTPSRLYEAVSRSSRRVCNSVPYKRRDLLTHALVM